MHEDKGGPIKMQDTINRILYLTHDKWSDRVQEVKYRAEFQEYLKLFIELKPEIEQHLLLMLEYTNKKKGLLTQKGLMNLLSKKEPEIHHQVLLRQLSKKQKKDKNI